MSLLDALTEDVLVLVDVRLSWIGYSLRKLYKVGGRGAAVSDWLSEALATQKSKWRKHIMFSILMQGIKLD